MTGYSPSPVPCAGCGKLTPYEVGDGGSFGEWLSTPIGRCYRRTHRDRECVQASRAAVHGRPVPEPVTAVERAVRVAA